MNWSDIDWSDVWRAGYEEKDRIRGRNIQFWDKRAKGFAERHVSGSNYLDQFLFLMNPEPGCSFLDVGCAVGTLAVPLALTADNITALDPSPKMIEFLKKQCREKNLTNIHPIQAGWEDDWDALGIGVHDIALASRSLIVADLRAAISKLDRFARKKVFITALVGDGPHDRRIFEAVGRKFVPGMDYIVVYNLLRQMGIYANVNFTVHPAPSAFDTLDQALERMRWMLHDITPEEEGRLSQHLRQTLIPKDGKLEMPYRHTVRWAVMWWEKETQDQPVL